MSGGGLFGAALLTVYAIATLGLSIIGMRKTKDLRSFALGKGDMSPVLVGITMAASIASTATFVINPGFVYTDGLSAYAHYGVAAMAGLAVALVVLSQGFQRIGAQTKAVTLPDWLKKRYQSEGLGIAFAVLSLLYISFVVLILAGSAIILSALFDIGYHVSLVGLLLFTFSYVLLGGTYAHAYTNAMQGGLMLIIAVALFFFGFSRMDGGFFESLSAVGGTFSSWTNPDSPLYYDVFSVFIAAFVVTAALMLQPHILTKILYLEKKEDLNVFLFVTIASSVCFSLMLFVGFFAKFDGLEIAAQDKVVVAWLQSALSPLMVSFVLVTLLAAGMSTLDGILVSISTVVVTDLVLPLRARAGHTGEAEIARGLSLSRYVLVVLGLISLALAWDPPKLLGLFAQAGVYGLVAASAAPILLGVLRPQFQSAKVAFALSLSGVLLHFGLKSAFGWANPGVSAAWAILITVTSGFLISLRAPESPPVSAP